jgi:cytoskeletal protein CcmA (bactofilin family)
VRLEQPEPLIIVAPTTLTGLHQRTVIVRSSDFELAGVIQGSLDIGDGVVARIVGKQQGSTSIAPRAELTISGALEGSVYISPRASVIVEAGGKLAGSVANDGTLTIRGVFGGAYSGSGEIMLEGSGCIKNPRIENGIYIYDWS